MFERRGVRDFLYDGHVVVLLAFTYPPKDGEHGPRIAGSIAIRSRERTTVHKWYAIKRDGEWTVTPDPNHEGNWVGNDPPATYFSGNRNVDAAAKEYIARWIANVEARDPAASDSGAGNA